MYTSRTQQLNSSTVCVSSPVRSPVTQPVTLNMTLNMTPGNVHGHGSSPVATHCLGIRISRYCSTMVVRGLGTDMSGGRRLVADALDEMVRLRKILRPFGSLVEALCWHAAPKIMP